MNIQIFGTKKCNDTKKAERFFKERGIKYQFVDMKEKGMSKGEFNSVAQANGGLENMINWDGKDKDLLALIKYIADEDKIVVELPIEKYDQYLQFKNDPNYIPIIHASIVQNALLAVLLQEDWSQNTDDLLWKRTIRYRVEHEEGLKKYKDFSDKENLIMLSHKLLGDPIQRMFDTITLCTNSDDD